MVKIKHVVVRRIRKTGSSLGINIPSEMVEELKLEENEIIRITVEKVKEFQIRKT